MEQRGDARMMAEARRTIWNDELSLQEKKDILEFIDSLTDEEMKRGYGAINKNGFIYTFNFAPTRKVHEDNLKTDGGFEIIHKVDVSGLNQQTQELLLDEANGESRSNSRFDTLALGMQSGTSNNSGSFEDSANRKRTENSVGLSDAAASDVVTGATDRGGEVGEEQKINTKNMSETEEILIQCLAAPDLRMRKETAMIVLSLLKTEKQKEKMVYWIAKNHKINPTEEEVIEAAEQISERTKE